MANVTSSSAGAANSLTGVVERIIFFNEENHYTIAELRPEVDSESSKVELVTIVGALPGVECGETLHLLGEWTRHAQHGSQFKINSFKSELPSSVHGIRKYLGSGLVPGIGKVYANKIVDVFGADTFRVLSEESGKLRKVEGIGAKRATAIKKAWDEKKTEREVYVFLQTYGVTPSQCIKLVAKYGAESQRVLLKEPYRVAREIDGIGFKTADKIAINIGFANDAAPRIDAGIIYALDTLQEDGHTAYGQNELRDHTANLLETSADLVDLRIKALIESKQIVLQAIPVVPDVLSLLKRNSEWPMQLVQLPNNSRAEEKIAESLKRIKKAVSALPPIKVDAAVIWAEEKAGFQFHELQRLAVSRALTHKITVLTGGPGTGKTTILRALVDILKAKKVKVHLAAPTGRAAQRLAETTGGYASTIHRLLKLDPGGGGFSANESRPLNTDFLIVDEASMLDSRLAAALLQAVPARGHLLLVGDVDQLPSVGAGDVLKDIIAVGSLNPEQALKEEPKVNVIPVTRLSVIYRQQGQSNIVTIAHAVNGGDTSPPPVVPDVASIPAWSDLTFVAADSAEDCVSKVIEICTQYVPKHFSWFHPIKDIQILAPMHKGVAGVANLNTQLQASMNRSAARGIRIGAIEFKVGDKVIQLKNNYDKVLFNGDIGSIVRVDGVEGTLTADFDGDRHEYTRGEMGELGLAYSITIHKSQGSEYPVVVIPLLKGHFMMLQRNLLYTAITRGRKKVFIVGEVAAYGMAVRNSEAKSRITHLREKIIFDQTEVTTRK
ncbi:MAG: ATP-dependent RecD-like DNA helicase [Verrucomicrobiota bacterium]|nr:MAG: ATP-dependent RecD-like DNA helicase [Verrucomicrobiota bacterium]